MEELIEERSGIGKRVDRGGFRLVPLVPRNYSNFSKK